VHDDLEPEIDTVRQGRDAASLFSAENGKATMDRIRAAIREIDTTESNEVQALLAQSSSAARFAREVLPASVAATVILSLLLAVVMARSITRPVAELGEAMERVAAGDLGSRVTVRSGDEIGRLAAHFNQMSEAIRSQHEEVMAQTEELQAQQEELDAQNEQLQAQQRLLSATMTEVEQDRAHLMRLIQVGRELLAVEDIQALSDRLLDALLLAGGAQVGALALLEPDGSVRIGARFGLTAEVTGITRSPGFLQEVASSGRLTALSYPHGELRSAYHLEAPPAHELYVPVRYQGKTLAIAALGRTVTAPFPDQTIQWLEAIASQAAAFLSSQLAYDHLQHAYTGLQESAAQIEELSAQIEEERDRVSAERDTLNAILQSTSEGIMLVGSDGQVLRVNSRFWELTGVQRDQVMTVHDISRVAPRLLKDPDKTIEAYRAINQEPTAIAETRVEMHDGRVLHRYTAPVHGRDERWLGRLFVYRDVTQETEIDKMKTEFISTVSHELRTPLTAIRGYVDLIREGDAGPISDEQREFLELVSGSTVRLANLINDLLDVEKIEQGRIEMRRETVGIGALLQLTVDTFWVNAAEKGLTCELAVEQPLPPVSGDSDRLAQVFSNLLSNAVKYTKRGGIRVRARATGAGQLEVSVSDTGIGIGEENLPNLFTKFFRVDNQYTREVDGTGLGLAITRSLVERHGGHMAVESVLGKGSVFTVTLPASRLANPGEV
jgi:PAS domain S-box-containing protein